MIASLTGIVALALSSTVTVASAQQDPVDIELVLAVDVSWSMDVDEQQLQRDGYVAAFRDPTLIRAIQQGGWGAIAVTYVEWAGSGLRDVIVPWTIVRDAKTAHAFADQLDREPAGRLRRTSISGAMATAQSLFGGNPYRGLRRVVDISGDGPNNQGLPVTVLRDKLVEAGITINGLPIMIKKAGPGSFFSIDNLDLYYRDCVIGGTGAFYVTVRRPSEFAAVIRRKLLLEIAGVRPRLMLAQQQTETADTDCLIGEKMWQIWMNSRDYFE